MGHLEWHSRRSDHKIDADFDKSGTYTVKITTADTAYALLLNDTGATVSDSNGGTLTLTGTGGSSNPNGVLAINAGTFSLAGGALHSGSISIASGGQLLVSASYTGLSNAIVDNGSITISGKNSNVIFSGNISGSGAINIQNGARATFDGAIGSETFTIASTSQAIVNSTVNGSGSFALSGSGSLEFGAAGDSENVTFNTGATGTLTLDHSLAGSFAGTVSGLTKKNQVDLLDLPYTPKQMSATFKLNSAGTGGVLTVTNAKLDESATLNLSGNYSTASWLLSSDPSGKGTLVVDPPVMGSFAADANGGAAGGIDLPNISFDVDTTLAYWMNSANTGGTLTVSDGLHAQSLALLGQYTASSFVMASDGHGGTLISDPSQQSTSAQLFFSHPHA